MTEAYSSGTWIATEGEGEAFVAAWTEFARWLSTKVDEGKYEMPEA